MPHWQVTCALVEAARGETELGRLVQVTAEALLAEGVPLARMAVGTLLLHPLLDATLAFWREGQEVGVIDTPRPEVRGDEVWRFSPFYHMRETAMRRLRYRLDQGEGTAEFALLAQLAAEGMTDYLALRTELGSGTLLGDTGDMCTSWVTREPGGFTAAHVRLIEELEPLVSLLFAGALRVRTAQTLLKTYLGADAGLRVLNGAIERGQSERIPAVIWFSDLRGFTRLSDSLEQQELLDLLNGYAEAQVDAIEAHGGQILKFMGDGILAIFRQDGLAPSSAAAIAAWRRVMARTDRLGERRAAAGQATTQPYLALHAGEVLYGNIGGRTRLDFTVLGPAVNETVRISALCRTLDQRVILSEAFAEAAGDALELAALGRFALRGVARPQMLYTLV